MELQTELKELQRQLAQTDLLTGNRQGGSRNGLVFLVAKLQNIKIKMYQENGHRNPHVHIDYGKHNHVATYSISEPARVVGNLDRKYDKQILEWIAKNKSALLKIWQNAQTGKDVECLVGALTSEA